MLKLVVSRLSLRGRRLGRSDRGATAVEYALIVSLIVPVIVAVVILFGQTVQGMFTTITTAW